MSLTDLALNLRTINNLNVPARQLVGENAARLVDIIVDAANGHDIADMPYDWYVDVHNGMPCASEAGYVQCDCYGGDRAGVKAGFICDCVNAIRQAVRNKLPSFKTDLQAAIEAQEAEIANLRAALRKASNTLRLTIENAEDVMQPKLVQEIAHCGSAVEAALRGVK